MKRIRKRLREKGYKKERKALFTWFVKGKDAWFLNESNIIRGRVVGENDVGDFKTFGSEEEALAALIQLSDL